MLPGIQKEIRSAVQQGVNRQHARYMIERVPGKLKPGVHTVAPGSEPAKVDVENREQRQRQDKGRRGGAQKSRRAEKPVEGSGSLPPGDHTAHQTKRHKEKKRVNAQFNGNG